MNLQDLKNQTILLLGKTRALEKDEFLSQLKHHDINCIDRYVDEVSFIIEGRMLNPIEQEEMEDLHKSNAAPFLHISALEKALCKEIDSSKLHMSLKLSSDEDRLLAFIKNEFITDELFLRLVSLHDWKNENFFENDENRDVTAALISRFYADIERNHNVQYATTGLIHLILQTQNSNLIEVISNLQPIKKALKDKNIENGTFKILQMIALHPLTPSSVIKMYIKNANEFLKAQVSTRDDLSESFQEVLYQENSELINETLSDNLNISAKIAKQMIKDNLHVEKISKILSLNDELFEILLNLHVENLALNPSLTSKMVETLFNLENENILNSLALNENLSQDIYMKLKNLHVEKISKSLAKNRAVNKVLLNDLYSQIFLHVDLAENISTPVSILQELSSSEDENILIALAKNTSTPISVLCQLQLDRKYDRFVKENKSFGKHITQDNIGWL